MAKVSLWRMGRMSHTRRGNPHLRHDQSCDIGQTWPVWHPPAMKMKSSQRAGNTLNKHSTVFAFDQIVLFYFVFICLYLPCSPWEHCEGWGLCEPCHVCSWTLDLQGPDRLPAAPSLSYWKKQKQHKLAKQWQGSQIWYHKEKTTATFIISIFLTCLVTFNGFFFISVNLPYAAICFLNE